MTQDLSQVLKEHGLMAKNNLTARIQISVGGYMESEQKYLQHLFECASLHILQKAPIGLPVEILVGHIDHFSKIEPQTADATGKPFNAMVFAEKLLFQEKLYSFAQRSEQKKTTPAESSNIFGELLQKIRADYPKADKKIFLLSLLVCHQSQWGPEDKFVEKIHAVAEAIHQQSGCPIFLTFIHETFVKKFGQK